MAYEMQVYAADTAQRIVPGAGRRKFEIERYQNMKLWIDNTRIEGEEGQSVLDAALAAGIYIPHICSHPDLEAQGGCKLCVVEIDGAKPVTACTTPAAEGMHVVTKSETLDQIRRMSLQFMLAGHPQCTGCRSFGNCEFQALHQYLGAVAHPEMREVHKSAARLVTNNPLIDRDMNRCIQCGRCVRACQELRGVKAIGYRKREDTGETYVGTTGDLSLAASGCRFCGACVEVCPTGALQDKEGGFPTGLPKDEALIPCEAECPAHINIPGYLRMIGAGEYGKAVGIIREKVPFPHSLGYVCTSYCQKGCKRKGLNGAVNIRAMKRFAAEHDETREWEEAYLKTAPATGKTVAVIGGGPCGLTAAFYLAKKGHSVTVLEQNPACGGMLRYGIPAYRLPKEDVQAEIDVIARAGVKLVTGQKVTDIRQVKQENDAVLLAAGASEGKLIPVKNRNMEQCTTAVALLRDIALGKETSPHIGPGTKVLIYGGGNVAFDAARSCRRLGAQVRLVCLEARDEMTADEEEIREALEEGVEIYPGRSNDGFLQDENGRVTGLSCYEITSFRFGALGLETEKKEGTDHIIPCNVAVFAAGQKTGLDAGFGLALNEFGYPVDPKTGKSGIQTSIPGVFAAGDVVTGTKAVIDAIAAGREAASKMDLFLGGDGKIEEQLVKLPPEGPYLGQMDGFAELPRNEEMLAPLPERVCSFGKVDLNYTREQAKAEADRCLKCPLRTQIQETKLWTAYGNEKGE